MSRKLGIGLAVVQEMLNRERSLEGRENVLSRDTVALAQYETVVDL